MIELKGFNVHFSGDSSVGIFDADWELTGGFNFDSEEDLEAFKEEILNAFEWVADRPCLGIATFEELEAEAEAEDRLLAAALYAEKERGWIH